MRRNKHNNHLYVIFTSLALVFLSNLVVGLRKYTREDVIRLREEVRGEFQHAYEGYLNYAYPYDELRPLSCDGVDTWGKYSLTLIDSLDTLAVMGNYSEFARVVNLLKEKNNFDADINVSVFETNIRIVGGLLSAHLMSHKAGVDLEPGWPCNGPLLRLAEDVARRLLPAFDTRTGMPYGTVNLRHGVPPKETTVTSTAGVGTYIVEFGTLSRLTGDPVYEEAALNALFALFNHRSQIGLVGNHVDIMTGRWTAQDSGIGSGVDSYFEYLVKGAVLLNRPELLHMFHDNWKAITKYLKRDDWYVWVSMNKGQVTLPVFQSLEAFWPGVLSMVGETNSAARTFHNYHSVWRQYGFMPEIYNIPNGEAAVNKEAYPLRPEHVESAVYLWRATGDPFYLMAGEDMLRSIKHSARTDCGYATIKNVRDHRKEDRMESFFLAETLKYLYLLFDPDNFIHNDGRSGKIITTPNGECLIDAGGYIFNTEAHPMDPGALRCCSEVPRENIFASYEPDTVVGDLLSEQPRKRKRLEKLKKPPKEPILDHLEITIEELQQFLEQAKKLNAEEMKNTSQPSTDDSLILPVEKVEEKPKIITAKQDRLLTDNDNNSKDSKVPDSEPPVEVVKLPSTRDAADSTPIPAPTPQENYTIVYKETVNSTGQEYMMRNRMMEDLEGHAGVDDRIKNNSVFQEFVQTIMKATRPSLHLFDAQKLLEQIRTAGAFKNESWAREHELFHCKPQPFLQRLSILGQFFY